MIVLCMKPGARLVVVSADECIERPEKAYEQERELALFRGGIEAAADSEARYRGLAGSDNLSHLPVTKAELKGGGHDRLGEDLRRIR